MKHKTIPHIPGVWVLLLTILFSCSDIIGERPSPTGDEPAPRTVAMRIRLGQEDGRSVLPQAPEETDIDYFELYGSIGDTEEWLISFYDTEGNYLEKVTSLENVVAYVRAGMWHFTLYAYQDVGEESSICILQGSKTVTLGAEETEDVVFELKPVIVEGEDGSVNLTINLPASSGADVVITTLDGETVTPALTIENNAVTYEEELPAGEYLIGMTFKDASDRTLAVVTEILVVRSNLLSVKTIELSETHFNAPPATPDGFSKEVSNGGVLFSWEDKSVNETGFVIEGGGNSYEVAAGAASYVITSADASDEYSIKAVNDFGESASIIAIAALPKPPAELTVSSKTANSVTLSWDAVSGAASYKIYRSSSAYGDYEYIGSTSSSTTYYTNSGLSSGSTYYYKVSAVNGSQLEGTLSAFVSAQTNALPPSAPTGLTSTEQTQTSVTLSWNAVRGATSYKIYRNSSYIGTAYSTYYTDSGLTPGMSCSYQVSAYNNAGDSPLSSIYSAMTTQLLAPTGVYAIPVSGGIRINWNAVSGASSYTVYRATSAYGIYTFLGAATDKTYLNTISDSSTYYYKVAANSSAGVGYQSSVVSSPAGGILTALPYYTNDNWLRATIANGSVQYYRHEAKAGYNTIEWADYYDGGDVTFTIGRSREKATADIVVSAWWESSGTAIFTEVDDGYYNYSSSTTFYSPGAYVILKVRTYDETSGGRYFIH
jgi:fibronectin type 3 domain-containing protein